MANGNTMNDMEMVNVKNQMKMGEMMKKIGKGKRKVSATFGLGSRRYLHKLIDELTKQIKKPKNGIMAYLDRKSNQKSKKPKLTIRKTGKSKPRLANAANFSG